MRANDVLVMASGVLLTPAEALKAELNERLSYGPGDYVISRPRSRGRSLIMDPEAAAFLEQFRSPKTVVEAVIGYSRETGADPERLLEDALPIIVRMRNLGVLAVVGSDEADAIEPTLPDSKRVGDYRVISCVHVFEDVEVYKVADSEQRELALKIVRSGKGESAKRMLEREAAILNILNGHHVPTVLSKGLWEEREYLVTAWCSGTDAVSVANALRSPLGLRQSSQLMRLCARILETYAWLHERGVVHADIHPGNIRVGGDGSITLLDFGLSWCVDESFHLPPPGRGGIAEYLEPEYCQSLSHNQPPPHASAASEQYALAVLCYYLLTGSHYLNFSLERKTWLQQVLQDPPRPFSICGHDPWPGLEQVLARALSKEPGNRFNSTAEFADAFSCASKHTSTQSNGPSTSRQLLDNVLQRFGRLGSRIGVELVDEPKCSINYGASGVAFFFYRLACLRDDAELLATADLWSSWSREHAGQCYAFYSSEIDITEKSVGPLSLYHSETGVQCVQALISNAMGDLYSANKAVRYFIAASDRVWPNVDLTVGHSSLLIGCAALIEALPEHKDVDRRSLYDLGERTLTFIWSILEGERMLESETISWLGIAHGWAGILYAALRWKEAAKSEVTGLQEKLYELADLARWNGRSAAWPLRLDTSTLSLDSRTGWCHGSAGYIQLWTLAHRTMSDSRFLQLAESAGNHLWESLDSVKVVNGSLCCGYAGQAYALLNLYRHTSDRVWLDRAATLCERAVLLAHRTERRASLYKGTVGIALLAQELAQPELSCMPMFEAERWTARV